MARPSKRLPPSLEQSEIVRIQNLVDQLLADAVTKKYCWDGWSSTPLGSEVAALTGPAARVALLRLCEIIPEIAERVRTKHARWQTETDPSRHDEIAITVWWNLHGAWGDYDAMREIAKALLRTKPQLSDDDWTHILRNLASFDRIILSLGAEHVIPIYKAFVRDVRRLGVISPTLAECTQSIARKTRMACSNRDNLKWASTLDEIARDRRVRAAPIAATGDSQNSTRGDSRMPTNRETTIGHSTLSEREVSEFDEMMQKAAIAQHHDYWKYSVDITDPAKSGAAYVLYMLRQLVELRRANASTWDSGNYDERSSVIDYRKFCILRNSVEAILPRTKLNFVDLGEIISMWRQVTPSFVQNGLIKAITKAVERAKLTDDPAFHNWLPDALACANQMAPVDRAWVSKVSKWMGLYVAPAFSRGEFFGEAAQKLVTQDGAQAKTWGRILSYAQQASGSSPSRRWVNEAGAAHERIGDEEFTHTLVELFAAAEKPRTARTQINSYVEFDAGSYELTDTSQDVLKGLAWMAASIDTPEMSRALGRLTLSAYKKVPGRGPRAVKVGNAAVWALSQQSSEASLGQLAMLNVKVKFGTAQKMIEKALNVVAAARGLPRAEIDELGVPSYGLEDVGRRADTLGETRLLLEVHGAGNVSLRYFKADGKEVKSPPAAIKQNFADDLKEFKASVKDIETMLGAQVARLDGLMGSQRVWSADDWQARYMQHPLIGVLARGLIWITGEAKAARAFVWSSGECVDATGQKVATPTGDQQVRLWHPIDATREQVVAWRDYFESRRIKQPFKQAHREVYLLTDAERRTATYSNRFAAHVIKQHQFHALALLRGWKNKLRLSVDAEFPATSKIIPWAGLRAEFWVEGIGDDYGVDTNDAGVYNLLATDQVRFYRAEAGENVQHAWSAGFEMNAARAEINEPVPIEQVPALALSEVLRDVDLFVGVCSVGNNPQWQDGGPEGRHRDYWWSYSFADKLTESGSQRRELLERLVPRLAIRDVCTFTDRFLVVKGKLRTYKIHMGSGNILMEPNDQYLCIVPGRSDAAPSDVFLPFDGDRVLSIILSKALMLAEDDKIKDSSITSQIRTK